MFMSKKKKKTNLRTSNNEGDRDSTRLTMTEQSDDEILSFLLLIFCLAFRVALVKFIFVASTAQRRRETKASSYQELIRKVEKN